MANLKTELCGVALKNPVIAASGTYGFGREYAELYDISLLGGICTKAVTPLPREGNRAPRIAETASGTLNAVGLQNPGLEQFLKNDLKFLRQKDTALIVNIAGATELDYCTIAYAVTMEDVDFVELNISCPNVKEGGIAFGVTPEGVRRITEQVKNHIVTGVPLMVKLSPNVASIRDNALAAADGGADCISLINTLTGMAISARTRRPVLSNVTGGLSGPAVKPVALRMVYEASRAVSIPVVGMGGIMTGEDAAEFMLCGASAVQVGTANLSDPMACPRIIGELNAFCDREGVKNVTELIGSLII